MTTAGAAPDRGHGNALADVAECRESAFMNTLTHNLARSALAIACFSAMSAQAALITVGPDADCSTPSIAGALFIAANNGTANDEIRVMEGIYQGVRAASAGISYTLTGGYNHCRLGAQVIGRSSLSGDFSNSVFDITGKPTEYHNVSLRHLNIANGGSTTATVSGGINASNLRLVLADVTVLNNRSSARGAGVSMRRLNNALSAILELHSGVRITGNKTSNIGGGIHLENASLRMRPDFVVIDSNQAREGGGIALLNSELSVGSYGLPETSQTATGLMIRDNIATERGGGVYSATSLLDFRETAFVRNRAGGDGGGIWASGGNVQVSRDASGPGVYCPSDSPCSRFEENSTGTDCPRSAGQGGAIAVYSARTFIGQTRLEGNCGRFGSAIFVQSNPGDPATDLEGIVTRNNIAGLEGTAIAGNVLSAFRVNYSTLTRSFRRIFDANGYTDYLNPTMFQYVGSAEHYVRNSILDTGMSIGWSNAQDQCNLAFADMSMNFRDADNGDYRLLTTSPAIDRCSNANTPAAYLDLTRAGRCIDSPNHHSNGTCDAGAIEFVPTLFDTGFRSSFE